MIRKALPDDLSALTTLFLRTIRSVNSSDYSTRQIDAWASGVKNQDRWQRRILDQYLILDEHDGSLRGFASITAEGYIDLMYVDKDHQNKGVAKNLYLELERYARERRIDQLESDVSITARPFFERMGFKVINEQTVTINSVALDNFKMTKSLING
jgi:putative acetyltransferase